jgi:hypothetical protein
VQRERPDIDLNRVVAGVRAPQSCSTTSGDSAREPGASPGR